MKIYTDGGEDKYCFVIPDKNIVKTLEKKGITNNEAEYLAVIEAIKHVEHGSRVKILTDSKLVANQLRMEWHIISISFLPNPRQQPVPSLLRILLITFQFSV